MVKKLFFILSLATLLLPYYAKAQQYEFGITGSATGYMGDINVQDPFYFKNLGGGLFVKYNLNPTWGIRTSFNYLPVYASDLDFDNSMQKNRGLMFNNNLKELSVTADFNFFRFIAGRQMNRYTPYLLGGISVINHNPHIYYNKTRYNLRDYPLEIDERGAPVTYSKWAIGIPVGAGFKYNIKGPWSIGAEVIYRTVLSDNIDNVSKYYRLDTNGLPTPWQLSADPSSQLDIKQGTLRGNGKNLDGYMTAGLKLTYTIISTKCYWWQ